MNELSALCFSHFDFCPLFSLHLNNLYARRNKKGVACKVLNFQGKNTSREFQELLATFSFSRILCTFLVFAVFVVVFFLFVCFSKLSKLILDAWHSRYLLIQQRLICLILHLLQCIFLFVWFSYYATLLISHKIDFTFTRAFLDISS